MTASREDHHRSPSPTSVHKHNVRSRNFSMSHAFDDDSRGASGQPRFAGDHASNTPSYDHPSDSESENLNSLAEQGRRSRDLLINTTVQAGTGLPHVDDTEQAEATKEKPVSWRALPRKDQLFVLTLARLSEPLTQTSLGSYLFYQLRSFDETLPDSTISYQVGIIQAAFPAAQFLTAMLWGQFADSEHGGRKRVLYIGLLGTMCSIIAFGFSRSFAMAVTFRLLGGVLNGNIGVMRTMISEIIKEKKYQSRAFLILPMTFNIGVIIGPILGMSSSPTVCHMTNNIRRTARGSCSKLPIALRSWISHRRRDWCTVDESLALRTPQSCQRWFPALLCPQCSSILGGD